MEAHYLKDGIIEVYYSRLQEAGNFNISLDEFLDQSWRTTDVLRVLRMEMINGIIENKIPKEDFVHVEKIEEKIMEVLDSEDSFDEKFNDEEAYQEWVKEQEKLQQYESYCRECKETGEEVLSMEKYFEPLKKEDEVYFENSKKSGKFLELLEDEN